MNDQPTPSHPQHPYAPVLYPPPQPQKKSLMRFIPPTMFLTLLLLLLSSVLVNVYMGAIVSAMLAGPAETSYRKGTGDKRVVVLPVAGLIDASSAEFVRKALDALRDKPPAAVVLRVDSGGGLVSAADRIYYDLRKFKSETNVPIVASYGSMAASGGYYISAFADEIFAEPTTITGSIGVIAEAFTFHELLGKIGVTPETIVSTQSTNKDVLNPMRPWTDADRRVLKDLLDHSYNRFIDVILESRGSKLERDKLTELATGRIFNAQDAKAEQLIDEIGYLDQAIDKAATLAGLRPTDKFPVTVIQQAKSFSLLGAVTGKSAAPSLPAMDAQHLRRLASELATPSLQYRLSP